MADPSESSVPPATAEALVAAARGALHAAYAPYSRFHVAAALLLEDGAVVTGVNVENVSYGLTICAERAAVATAVGAGHRRIRAVAVVTGRAGRCTPCGACRQVLAEFASPDAAVILEAADGSLERVALADLLPRAFDAIPAE